jgi:uncharacterized Zn-binding protein involved in type VI secretion
MPQQKLSYRGASTDHGGIILPGIPHNVNVDVGGGPVQASLDLDPHACPIPGHGVNYVIATGFAKFNGIKHTRVGDSCACGATVVGESDNTWSD